MKITNKITTVEKLVKTQVRDVGVTIELNNTEARILRELLGYIGGGGPVRKITDELMNGLDNIVGGVNYPTYFNRNGYFTVINKELD